MKKLLMTGVAASALMTGHAALAADMPMVVKAPVMMPAWSWTGCFVGAQTGWGWQRNKINQTQFNTLTSGGILRVFSSAASGNLDSSGGVFGGQVGCDYQFSGNWVVGAQGTFLGSNISGLDQDPFNGVVQTVAPPGAGLVPARFGGGSIAERTKWIASATGRLGWAGWSPQTLFYVRGGGAWVDSQLDMRSSAVGFNQNGATFPGVPIFDTKYSGWTIGGGAEWAIASSWSAFVEYNFYDFQSKSLFATGGTPHIGPGVNIAGRTLDSDVTISTITIGLNYRFGHSGH